MNNKKFEWHYIRQHNICLFNVTSICYASSVFHRQCKSSTDNMLKEKLRVKEQKSETQENQTTQNRMTWKDKLEPDTNRI